jgi:hypothetical protein
MLMAMYCYSYHEGLGVWDAAVLNAGERLPSLSDRLKPVEREPLFSVYRVGPLKIGPERMKYPAFVTARICSSPVRRLSCRNLGSYCVKNAERAFKV